MTDCVLSPIAGYHILLRAPLLVPLGSRSIPASVRAGRDGASR